MGTLRTAGFTILETMLFLAITGLLIVALLTGVGASINTQRYRDSVQSLKAGIQDQYTQLTSVENTRTNGWTCDSNGKISEVQTGQPRGQSNCVILGKYMVIDNSDITIQDVIGNQIGTTTSGTDVALLKANYKVSLSTTVPQTTNLEWAASISWPVSGSGAKPVGTDRSIGILLVRSPDSGIVYTFTVDSPPPVEETSSEDLTAFLVPGDTVNQTVGGATVRGQAGRTICVIPGGVLTTGGTAIYLVPFATNVTSVETRTNEFIQSLTPGGGGSVC